MPQTVLPSTIINLSLSQFLAHPNPFIPAPTAQPRSTSASPSAARNMSPIIRHCKSSVPRLTTLCLNVLISPRPPSNLPPLLDAYDWDGPEKGELHLLLDAPSLHRIIHQVSEADLRRMLQALRTAGSQYAQSKSDGQCSSHTSLPVPSQARFDPFPRSNRPASPEDASANPYFYSCPSPRHLASGTAHRHLFLHHAEERIEWREVFGIPGRLPVKWLGCSPGCLAFLEEDEEEGWTLED